MNKNIIKLIVCKSKIHVINRKIIIYTYEIFLINVDNLRPC